MIVLALRMAGILPKEVKDEMRYWFFAVSFAGLV
jgi:hypothetical protein